MDATATAERFFDDYAAALIARDPQAIAAHYAVPALILFPGQSIAVAEASQTEQFFAGALAQYEGVQATRAEVHVASEAEHSIWADVTWVHDGRRAERMMYQLVLDGEGWRIAVLTPLAV